MQCPPSHHFIGIEPDLNSTRLHIYTLAVLRSFSITHANHGGAVSSEVTLTPFNPNLFKLLIRLLLIADLSVMSSKLSKYVNVNSLPTISSQDVLGPQQWEYFRMAEPGHSKPPPWTIRCAGACFFL